MPAELSDPVLNGPFDPPEQHYEVLPDGPSGRVLPGRRRSESWVPVPQVRKGRRAHSVQEVLDLDTTGERREANELINDVRRAVETWRRTYAGVSPVTRKLLHHWSDPARGSDRVLFCQREAVETAIFLTEVAGRKDWSGADWRRRVDEANAVHNDGMPRTALKMATGSGKTVVMAMLIAWQTLNHAHSPRDARFTNRFLVVTPGITIRDRLRVLLPSDVENYYRLRDLVPSDLEGALRTAHVVITNYHAFLPRDRREIKGVAARTRQLLVQDKADPFRETSDDVVSRVLRDFGSGAGRGWSGAKVLVLNDEAHHCYQDKPLLVDDGDAVAPDAEARERNASARVWWTGLRAIQRKVGLKGVYDLSATPYYLSGSGYNEGYIFPWTVSDFSLLDAIESGIVKVPRFPVDDDAQGEQVTYLNLWDAVGKELPKRRAKDVVAGGAWTPPKALEGATRSLYRSYLRSFEHYERELEPTGAPPPVFIVVCPNTVVSKLVHDWIAGYEVTAEDGSTHLRGGNLEEFSNVDDSGRWFHRPRTLLIDSAQLESGEGLSDDFKRAAATEIDAFKAEQRRRSPGADVEALDGDDAALLREVMNTVGRPGRLGGDVRCVVSVSMLTEGWDANTVTHVLGVRAFGSQLLCEQVVGRGLRRRSYALNDQGRFDAEYASVYGVPFSFISGEPGPEPKPPPPAQEVYSVPGREHLRIRFPHVDGYRLEVPDDELVFDIRDAPRFAVRQEQVATWTRSAGIAGEEERVDLSELERKRPQEIAYEIARRAVETERLRAGTDRRPWLFPRVVEFTREWLDHRVDMDQGLALGYVTMAEYCVEAAEEVARHVGTNPGSGRERLRPMLRRFDPEGSTAGVSFLTRKAYVGTEKSEVSHVVLDGRGGNTWEQILAGECEQHRDVAAYVKNDHVGLTIPYVHRGVTHSYVPDFLVRLRQREGDVVRTLIVEVSGGQKSPGPTRVKAATARDSWCAAVNNHSGFGRWGYVEITSMPTARERLGEAIQALYADQPIVEDPDLLDAVL